MTEEIRKTLDLNCSIERAWRAITDADELAAWFPDDGAEFEADAGFDGSFTWAKYGTYALRVEEVEPGRRIVWSWAREPDSPLDEVPSTTVEWKLSPNENGGTRLELREWGFETDQAREENNNGWDAELGELAAMLAA